MRARIHQLLSRASASGIYVWVSGLVGGVGILVVGAVMLSSIWTARLAANQAQSERVRIASGVASLVAARTDLLLRESDPGAVRRQMIDLHASGLVRSCRVTLAGVGVIASTDSQSIGALTVPQTWSSTPVASENPASEGDSNSVRIHFEVPGRGAGVVEATYEPPEPLYAQALARAGGVALVAVCVVWFVFSRFRDPLSTVGRICTALGEAATGERRAEVLRVAEDSGTYGNAWNTLLDERDRQDSLIAGHMIASTMHQAPGENAGVIGVCDTLTHGVVAVAHNRRLAYVNGAAGVLLGCQLADLERAEFSAAFPDETVRNAITECLDSCNPVRRTIEIVRGEPGRDPDAELRLSVRSVEVGGVRLAGILIEDITQQRVADRSRNSFVAQATHELRTPLTNIRLYIEQAVDEGENDPQLRAQALNVISSEARRLERIVTDMLSVAEIEAGSLSIRPGDVRTDSLFDDLSHDYTLQAAEKNIEMAFDIPPKMPVICGDRDRLGQALHNLVGNALKYTPPGGKVTVRVEAPEQGGLIVHVIDTGIGIDPEECERIFERFYRANDRRIAHVTGSGLGLSLAREIVRLHGGDIVVESKLDQGSTFTITLPASEQTRQQRAA